MVYDIITAGSAALDVFVRAGAESRVHGSHEDLCYHKGEKILIKNIFFLTGGGGTNSAVAFSRLGLKTGFIGAIGNDSNSNIIKKELENEKISFLGKQKKGNSGYSIILLDRKDRTILSYKGANNNLELKDINLHSLNTKYLYLSTMLGKSFFTVKKLAEYAKRKGISTTANISSYEASLGISKLSSFLKNIDILIFNREEAEKLCNSKNIIHCSNLLLRYIRKIVVITDGYKPINIFTKRKSFAFPVKKVNPIDTTGAGDAFASGFLYGIIKDKDIMTSLNYGVKESRAVIQAIGAKTALLKNL